MPDAPKIAVFAHVHYPDIWEEIGALLSKNLTLPFHLIVTSSHDGSSIPALHTPALLSSTFLKMENRGRDILPFIHSLCRFRDFEIGLKLHTKKSPQREDGALWRGELLSGLLPSAEATRNLVERLQDDKRVGIVSPDGFCLSVEPWILQSRPKMEQILNQLDRSLSNVALDKLFFAAGSMFWFRRDALSSLIDPQLSEVFESEESQLDGTAAHAMERLFPALARDQGFISLSTDALLASRTHMSRSELLHLAQRHADIPNRYFPGPNIASPPLYTVSKSRTQAAIANVYRAAARYSGAIPDVMRSRLRRIMFR